jgi:hypothetical protein
MRTCWVCALIVACGLIASADAQTIYKQDVFPGEGFSSTYDPTAAFAFLAADNFTLSSSQTIGRVRWWGNSDDFGLPNLQNFTQFKVTLHQRLANGLPGAIIDQETFATANTNPVDTGLLSTNGTHVWQQTATLATPQTLPAGQYMLSVGVSGYVDNQGSIWFWNTSLQGDDFIAFDAYDGGGWRPFTQPLDLSFELLAVPEPRSAAGAIGGLLAVAIRRRRK